MQERRRFVRLNDGLRISVILVVALLGHICSEASGETFARKGNGPIRISLTHEGLKLPLNHSQRRPTWHRKETRHFTVFYQERYIDCEKVYGQLASELGIELKSRIQKVKVFIQPGRAYAVPQQRKLFCWDVAGLRHELTHLLFYQLSRSAPIVLQEGVATYKQANSYLRALDVGLEEMLDLEANSVETKNVLSSDEGKLYRCSSAWVGRLIEGYGIEKFKEFYRLCKNESRIKKVYEQIY